MTEAWCLFDEPAIRRAAGNPNGRIPLEIPGLDSVESLPDPKATLRGLLREASGLRGRRLRNLRATAERVTALIEDFAPLRGLGAVRRFEEELEAVLQGLLRSRPGPG